MSNAERFMVASSVDPKKTVRLELLVDPAVEAIGHSVWSEYTERFWLPVLGPSSICILRNFVSRVDDGDDIVEAGELAFGVGLGHSVSKLMRSIDRLCRFGACRRSGNGVAVRRFLSDVPVYQVGRFPQMLQVAHGLHLAEKGCSAGLQS